MTTASASTRINDEVAREVHLLTRVKVGIREAAPLYVAERRPLHSAPVDFRDWIILKAWLRSCLAMTENWHQQEGDKSKAHCTRQIVTRESRGRTAMENRVRRGRVAAIMVTRVPT